MCKPASMVLDKPKVYWLETSDSHEDIISQFNLGHLDRDLNNPGLVRVEISPPNMDLSLPPEQWVYKVDQDVLPDWYDPEDAEKRARIALEKWIAAKVLLDGKREISEGTKYASGSARVDASGSAGVDAYGSAHVDAYDSASVDAYDSASVDAYDSASVDAYDSASVDAYGSAHVDAYGSAHVDAYDSASVDASGSARVDAYDSASVDAYDSAHVDAYDSASVDAYDSASVDAYGSAHVDAYGSAHVDAYDSATIIKWSARVIVELKSPQAVLVDRSGDQVVCHVGAETYEADQ